MENYIDVIALVISITSLVLYIAEINWEYISIWLFSNYEVVLIPNRSTIEKSTEKVINEFSSYANCHLQVCHFKPQWIGKHDKIYYCLTYKELKKIKDSCIISKQDFFETSEYTHVIDNYFMSVIVTKKGSQVQKGGSPS